MALIPTRLDFCNGEKEIIIDVCKNCEKKKRVTQVSRAGEETIAVQNENVKILDETTLTSKSSLKLSYPLILLSKCRCSRCVSFVYKDAAVGLFANALDIHCCFWYFSTDQIACFADFFQSSVSFLPVFLGTV